MGGLGTPFVLAALARCPSDSPFDCHVGVLSKQDEQYSMLPLFVECYIILSDSVSYIVYRKSYIVYSIQYTVYSIQYLVFSILVSSI